ncbi:hypothetical protein MLD38_000881 [Melastoma candidum]|uniref:Uncharacterized protein n=2 Tax=Melastoma candidum TaxID=119954 RepID=A0ACB9SGE3_9MYRT|nr:hypothetical protein MLD38_000881 [Melastoma candidum]
MSVIINEDEDQTEFQSTDLEEIVGTCRLFILDRAVCAISSKLSAIGAALFYGQKFWSLGVTPTESQIQEIANWLLEYHSGSTGLSMDSLAEAGYPGALTLADVVCGMASTRITLKEFLFWFRSVSATEVKWGSAENDPMERDDGKLMHPRSSFQAFLKVVKQRSVQWEHVEMDAIHSLQLISMDSLRDSINDDSKSIHCECSFGWQ